MNKKLKIFIVAGEASGDNLGAKLMKALQALDMELEFRGVAGDKMKANGCFSYFDIYDIAIMGFVEVVPKIPLIFRRINYLVQKATEYKPDLIITIDSYGFNYRLVSKLRSTLNNSAVFVHYVAPTVWAYNPKRANVIASLYDHQLLILPFEKPFFDRVGVNSTFIGHPIIEEVNQSDITNDRENIIIVMPGSRKQEVRHHTQLFKQAIELFGAKFNHTNYKFFIPTLPHLETVVRDIFGTSDRFIISSNEEVKHQYFSKAKVALVKAGTSSVEMMAYRIPCVVAYKMFPLTYWWLKRKVNISFISICNLVLNKGLIPELIQHECEAGNIALKLHQLVTDQAMYNNIIEGYKEALSLLGANSSLLPSQIAASVIKDLILIP